MTLLRAIIVEGSDDDRQLILRALKNGGFDVMHTCLNRRKTIPGGFA